MVFDWCEFPALSSIKPQPKVTRNVSSTTAQKSCKLHKCCHHWPLMKEFLEALLTQSSPHMQRLNRFTGSFKLAFWSWLVLTMHPFLVRSLLSVGTVLHTYINTDLKFLKSVFCKNPNQPLLTTVICRALFLHLFEQIEQNSGSFYHYPNPPGGGGRVKIQVLSSNGSK